ncbi:hypothetical protein [Shouchella shacheensis]|uniref:hypothetical protein n=1 Tax=Shouchella shacheensis TaxID=1649580 RepID=UPI00073FB815|nr:hypothetical protein [Shouchella shacheensis]
MKQYQALLKVLFTDIFKSYVIFWSIYTLITVASYTIAYLTSFDGIYQMGIPFALIWVAVHSFQAIKNDFPYIIQLGATRRQFTIALSIFVTILVGTMALTHFLHVSFFTFIAEEIQALVPVTLVTWDDLGDSISATMSLVIDVLLGLAVAFLMVLLASLLYRFGKLPVYGILAVMAVTLLTPAAHQNLIEWLVDVATGDALYTVFWLLPIALLLIVISGGVLQRASFR